LIDIFKSYSAKKALSFFLKLSFKISNDYFLIATISQLSQSFGAKHHVGRVKYPKVLFGFEGRGEIKQVQGTRLVLQGIVEIGSILGIG